MGDEFDEHDLRGCREAFRRQHVAAVVGTGDSPRGAESGEGDSPPGSQIRERLAGQLLVGVLGE